MTYGVENKAKADFRDVYTAPMPHDYVLEMARHGYQIGEQARPYCAAAVELMMEQNGNIFPVQMLDIGCSYGMGTAFVKYGCSFDEMVAFFTSRAPKDYSLCCEATRNWVNVTPPDCNVRCVGLDNSEEAIRFALDAGLLDGGITTDFEQRGVMPNETERAWFRSCNLLISTGAIGYVTERTLSVVLRDLGRNHPDNFGPCAVLTILRMFDTKPITEVFEEHGLVLVPVPEVRLPQRRFVDREERATMLSILHNCGIVTEGWEDGGKLFADLFVAAPPDQVHKVLERMNAITLQCQKNDEITYISR